MSVDDVKIDSDEGTFWLVLAGDFCDEAARYLADGEADTLTLRLPLDAAVRLAAQVRERIEPWLREMEEERQAWEAAGPGERARVLRLADFGPGDGHSGSRSVEALVEAGDLLRKQRKENGA